MIDKYNSVFELDKEIITKENIIEKLRGKYKDKSYNEIVLMKLEEIIKIVSNKF